MYYTYILISETSNKLYIGQTNNLEARIYRHNASKNFTTKNKGPWILISQKVFVSRSESMTFEKKLKSHKNKKLILDKIKNDDF